MKEYRQNSHRLSLLCWALLCTATASFCFVQSHHLISRTLRTEETLVGILFLVLGPLALAAYLVRARTVWVGLDANGLIVSGGRTIPWGEIREVRRRRPLLRSSTGPAQVTDFKAGPGTVNLGSGCADVGCFTGISEFFIAVVLFIAVAWAVWVVLCIVVPLVIIPVLEVFIPFGDLIKIRTGTRTLVLRDLSDADEFMARIGEHVRMSPE